MKTSTHCISLGISLGIVLGLALTAGTAAAQDMLEEVVVTAGFRESSLLETPGSASVIDADAIAGRAAEHLESMLGSVPNLSYSAGASRARFIQVRGIGDLEQFVDPKHYPSVGVAVDDIDLGGAANAAMLFDAERVEVLRGPQGTRFGTSALAGLVSVQSRRPTDTFEGYMTAGLADYATSEVGLAVGGPLAERLSGRVALQQHRSDGYMDNAYLGRHDTNGFDETTLRANLVFDPTDTASYSFTALGFDSDNGYDAFSLDNTRVTLSDEPGRDAQHSAGLAARGSWQLGSDSSIEAVATWLDSDLEYGFDEDWTYVGICDGTLCDPVADFYSNTDFYARKRNEVTADLRWLAEKTAPNGRSRRYVLGFYAQQRDEDLARSYYGDFASAYATERRALYGQAELGLTGRLGLTLGLRYERFDDRYDDSFGFGSGNEDELHNGEITLDYALANDAFVYATISRGDKAGGVNTEASANLPFMQPIFQSFLTPRLRIGSESLINRELGFKARFAGGRLRFSSALFRMRRDNAQLESWVWDAQNFLWIGFLDNADGSNEGLEAELSYTVNERWELGAGIGLLETQIDELVTFDLDLGQFVTRRDIEQAKAPSWQFNLRARWRPSERWLAEIDLEGHDGSRFGYYHDRMLPRRTVLGASLRRSVGRAELSLWGRNLTDEDVPVHGLYFGNDPRKGWINESYYQFGEPRILGLGLRYSF